MERYVSPEEGRQKLLESYLRPQWGWKTFAFIGLFILIISLITIDLKVKPMELLSNTFTYLTDVLARMMPPDFSGIYGLMSSTDSFISRSIEPPLCSGLSISSVENPAELKDDVSDPSLDVNMAEKLYDPPVSSKATPFELR